MDVAKIAAPKAQIRTTETIKPTFLFMSFSLHFLSWQVTVNGCFNH